MICLSLRSPHWRSISHSEDAHIGRCITYTEAYYLLWYLWWNEFASHRLSGHKHLTQAWKMALIWSCWKIGWMGSMWLPASTPPENGLCRVVAQGGELCSFASFPQCSGITGSWVQNPYLVHLCICCVWHMAVHQRICKMEEDELIHPRRCLDSRITISWIPGGK